MALPEAGAVNRSQRVSANEGRELVRSVHITMRVIRCMSKDFSQPSSQHACGSAWIFLLSISVSFSSDERLQKISLWLNGFRTITRLQETNEALIPFVW